MVFFYKFITAISVVLVTLSSCADNAGQIKTEDANHKDSVKLSSTTFKTADGWGYNILVDNKIFINQTNIPAIQGVKSFDNQKDAENVSLLVISKIKAHKKPTIIISDLQNLGIVK